MCHILPAIDSLDQHIFHLQHHPEDYRPQRCPHCGRGGVWRHGHYRRKADREGNDGIYLEPVPIPRFYCRHCQATCSRLPVCIAPRRWYSWSVQQAVLAMLLSGLSLRTAARMSQPGRHTIRRWWRWLADRFSRYSFHLRSHFPELGRSASQTSFWLVCFRRMSLAAAMAVLDRDGVTIP